MKEIKNNLDLVILAAIAVVIIIIGILLHN